MDPISVGNLQRECAIVRVGSNCVCCQVASENDLVHVVQVDFNR